LEQTRLRAGRRAPELRQIPLDLLAERLFELGARVTVEDDFDALLAVRGGTSDPWIYPSFDPRLSALAQDALWLRATTPRGETVGTYALRVFQTEDFYDLMRRETLWFAKGTAGCAPRCEVSEPVAIAGTIGHCGAAWTHPAWRGRGLVQLLCRYARGLLLREFGVDHETALVFEHHKKSGLAERAYRYARVEKVIDGFFPPTETMAPIYLCHSTQREMLADLREAEATCATREFA
jgi:GNAT superfamily N-acetyltransferase